MSATLIATLLSTALAATSIEAAPEPGAVVMHWPAGGKQRASVRFRVGTPGPLLAELKLDGTILARDLDPIFTVTTGARKARRPGERYIFFDKPVAGKTETHVAALSGAPPRIEHQGKRSSLFFPGLVAGPFAGELRVHVYAGSPLLHIEAAMAPATGPFAYIYDAVLDPGPAPAAAGLTGFAWKDTADAFVREPLDRSPGPIAVRHRTVMAETTGGTLAVFPPPHAFFYPHDYTNNFKFVQAGAGRFGLRQDPVGGPRHQGEFLPWFDANPGRTQRMGMFVLLSAEKAEPTLERVLAYTHGDRFKPMPGRRTFASHFHFELAQAELDGKPTAPEVTRILRDMNVNLVHLAEFHLGGNPKDPGPQRLHKLKTMFDLCRRFSDENLLLIPGEEANAHLYAHWLYLFPRPVYLTLTRREDQPFEEHIPPYGRVYHTGSEADMVRVLQQESALAWTAHPRIKSSWQTPDRYRDTDWYKSDLWLGGGWKNMPGDLSTRAGARSLDLLDDMNTWGQRKMVHGEVDTFTLDSTHELYGHMNVNYLRLADRPTADDWSPVLKALRKGDFFVTSGEILIHDFQVRKTSVTAEIEWTFPLEQALVVWWDGATVQRKTIALHGTSEQGRARLRWPIALRKARWVRLEAWDVAQNGAFTQPSWLPGRW